ncbi:MAG: hypothetical protein KKD38_07175 [Candidatus Delongbacteria bacterium]|nr:hypothetical protein [Candidatus Delongbacteria bacterium]
MKYNKLFAVLMILCSIRSYTDIINVNPDPKGEPWYTGGLVQNDENDLFLSALPRMTIPDDDIGIDLPASYDITESEYFRNIFTQSDGSCAQASMIGYIYTYKANKVNNATPATLPINQYPTHFTYNFVNNNSGGRFSTFEQAIRISSELGIPNSEAWKEETGDYLAGEIGIWMSGYEKYKEALHTKSKLTDQPNGGYVIDVNCDDNQSALETLSNVKYYLSEQMVTDQNISIDGPLSIGMNMGLGADYEFALISLGIGNPIRYPMMINTDTDYNLVDHALTVVGYDDNIGYDFNKDKKINNSVDINGDRVVTLDEWELGALKVVNSWGKDWPIDDESGEPIGEGYFYLPYRFIHKLTKYEFCRNGSRNRFNS